MFSMKPISIDGEHEVSQGFSKRMQPRIDELARRTRATKSFAVMKIDDTCNDVTRKDVIAEV